MNKEANHSSKIITSEVAYIDIKLKVMSGSLGNRKEEEIMMWMYQHNDAENTIYNS